MKKKAFERRDAATNRFLDEVGAWLAAMGGKGIVAGPVRLVSWPEDQARNLASPPGLQFFAVDVKVIGRKPPKEAPVIPPPNGVHRLGTFNQHSSGDAIPGMPGAAQASAAKCAQVRSPSPRTKAKRASATPTATARKRPVVK